MFVAQTSRARLPEKLKRHRCVVALVFLTLLACIVTGAVTSVMFAQDQTTGNALEGECERHDAYENSCCNFGAARRTTAIISRTRPSSSAADDTSTPSCTPTSASGAWRPLDAARQHVLRPHASEKKPPFRKRGRTGCKSDSFVDCGLAEQEGERTRVSTVA